MTLGDPHQGDPQDPPELTQHGVQGDGDGEEQDPQGDANITQKRPVKEIKSGKEMLEFMRKAKANQQLREKETNSKVGGSKLKHKTAKNRKIQKAGTKIGHMNTPSSHNTRGQMGSNVGETEAIELNSRVKVQISGSERHKGMQSSKLEPQYTANRKRSRSNTTEEDAGTFQESNRGSL